MLEKLLSHTQSNVSAGLGFLVDGGPSIWAIAALSILGLTVVLWKTWRLALVGAWSARGVGPALDALRSGQTQQAVALSGARRGMRSRFLNAAIRAKTTLPVNDAKDETARVAKLHLANANAGLRVLELIATIAPLLGLLGTVLGMIAAFQTLQEAGARTDAAALAGGIWEALLTTAAGMAVAIPATAALTWFESVIESMRLDMEDAATLIFTRPRPDHLKLAAE